MRLIFIIALLASFAIQAQQSQSQAKTSSVFLPMDRGSYPIYGGMGTPVAASVTVTADAYGTHAIALDTTGVNANRNWRNIHINNKGDDEVVSICFSGSAVTCTDENMIIPASVHVVYDQILFGPNNGITHIHLKRTGGASAAVDVTYW